MHMNNIELFWEHLKCCGICNQHPQSVASFFYEPMCRIGRSYHAATDLPGPRRVQPHTVLVGEQGDNERVEGSQLADQA